jgi:hypothetical protein
MAYSAHNHPIDFVWALYPTVLEEKSQKPRNLGCLADELRQRLRLCMDEISMRLVRPCRSH